MPKDLRSAASPEWFVAISMNPDPIYSLSVAFLKSLITTLLGASWSLPGI